MSKLDKLLSEQGLDKGLSANYNNSEELEDSLTVYMLKIMVMCKT